MTGERKDGGQAFPQPVTVGPNDDMYPAYPGMTLRDWFAGQALAGITGHKETHGTVDEIGAAIANAAYGIADAMLAERSK